jgi:plasmid segregation protein ParM
MPRNKKSNKITTDVIVNIGLDVGYGHTKLVSSTSKEAIIFPSVMGHARNVKYGAETLAERYPGDQLTDNEGAWFVGDLAQSQLRAGEQISLNGRTSNEETGGNLLRVRLAKAAIGKLFAGESGDDVIHMVLSTGLPVDHMPDAPALKAALLGQHRIQTDNTSFIANITDVMVMPQPLGTLYSQMLKAGGNLDECYTHSRTGIIDVGRYTVDLVYDDDGEFISDRSGSREGGVYLVQERIADAYEQRFRSKADGRDVDRIIRGDGCIRVRGLEENFVDERLEAVAPLIDGTLDLARQKWGGGQFLDVIYVSGGGAPLVVDEVIAEYPQAESVTNAQTANARGYLYYAQFASQED